MFDFDINAIAGLLGQKGPAPADLAQSLADPNSSMIKGLAQKGSLIAPSLATGMSQGLGPQVGNVPGLDVAAGATQAPMPFGNQGAGAITPSGLEGQIPSPYEAPGVGLPDFSQVPNLADTLGDGSATPNPFGSAGLEATAQAIGRLPPVEQGKPQVAPGSPGAARAYGSAQLAPNVWPTTGSALQSLGIGPGAGQSVPSLASLLGG